MLSKGCYESPEIQEKRAGRVSFCTGANVTEKSSAGKGWWASGQSLDVMVALVGAAGPELRLPAAKLQGGSLEPPGCRAAGARLRCRKRGARSTRHGGKHGGKGRHLGSTCFPDRCSRRCSTLLKQRDLAKLKKGAGMLCTYLNVKVLMHTSIHTQCCCETG